NVRRARKSIAAFKLREGMPVGVAVTLRGERSYEFLDRLVTIAIPRIRDFRGLSPRSFDGRGNYSMGVKEQIIFPEVDYDAIDVVRGLDITITTSAATDMEAYALLAALGMPFAAQGRPAGFDPAADEAEAREQAGAKRSQGGGRAQVEAAAAPEPPAEATEEPAPEAAEAAAAEEPAAQAAEPEAADEAAEAESAADHQDEAAAEPAPEAAEAESAESESAEAAEPGEAPENGTADTSEKESTD